MNFLEEIAATIVSGTSIYNNLLKRKGIKGNAQYFNQTFDRVSENYTVTRVFS